MNPIGHIPECVIIIVDKKTGKKVTSLLDELSVRVQLMLHGRGTAGSEVLDYLGLDEPEKDILLALMPQPQRKRLLRALERKLSMSAPGNGIACSLPLFAISSCAVACLQQESSAEEAPCQAQQPQARQEHNADQESADTLKEEAMSMNIEHSMIITLISPEYTEIVIQAAKAAGAAGGTVCKAKSVAADDVTRFLGVTIQPEKELVLQVVSAAEQNNIMQAICRDVTRYSGERAMVFALPVCAAVGLRQLDDFDL